MSYEDAIQLIMGIRNNRMQSKRIVKETRKASEKKEKKASFDLSAMNTEDLEKLIEKLEAKND